MATLQKLRDKAGVLVAIVIGGSLLAFILGGLLKSSPKADMSVGEINGNKISIQEYQQQVDEIVENTKKNTGKSTVETEEMEGIYNQAWQAMIINYIVKPEYEGLGIAVSASELEDMVKGKFIDPQMLQIPIFKNQQTGQFDKSRVVAFLKNIEQDPSGEAKASWVAFEKNMVLNKTSQKYAILIQKGYYPTKLEVEDMVNGKNNLSDIQYVQKKYSEIADKDVKYTDADLKTYYDNHTYQFQQEESRAITYVTFDVKPSEEDAIETEKWMEKNKEEFKTEENPVRYINLNSDQAFDDTYYAKGELPAFLDTFMFAADTGAITDIYKEGNTYKIAKLISIKELPDSAKARHILLRASQEMPAQKVVALADSLKKLIENGADFAALAEKYSEDKGSAIKGGELDWFQKKQMVKPFEKACFEGKKGDVVIVESQFGLHIIEIEDQGVKQKKVQVGYLAANVEPSEKTDADIYTIASKFAGENRTKEQFEKAAEEQKLIPRIANNIQKADYRIAGLESPRTLIRWVYENEEGTVSDVFKLGDKYIVALLKEVREKGTMPFELAKTEIEREVIKEKKAEKLLAEFNNAKANDLNAIANKLSTSVETARNISFGQYSIVGIGYEPALLANAVYNQEQKLITPIKGENGVFAMMITKKRVEEKTNAEQQKSVMQRAIASHINYQLIDILKSNATITDNRLNHY